MRAKEELKMAGGRIRRSAAAVSCAALLLVVFAAVSPAQPLRRNELLQQREKTFDWCRRNGVILLGMTKEEVLKIYGQPDRRFNFQLETDVLEKWSYNFPRQRGIIPFRPGPHASRYRSLYFRDEVLVNVER